MMMTPEDATVLAADVELSVEQLDEPAWQRHPKRAKLRPNQAAHDDCSEATPTGPPPWKATTDVASVVAEAVKSTLMAVKDELAADRAAASGNSSHGQVEMVGEASGHHRSIVASSCKNVLAVVDLQTLTMAVQAMDRAHVAALHSQRLCSAALNVLDKEAQRIWEAKMSLMKVLPH